MTLLELLAAVGVLAILLALVFPAYRRIAESGRATECLSNLRQVGVAYRDIRNSPETLHVDLAVMWRRGEPSSVVTAFLDVARTFRLATTEAPRADPV